MHHAERPRRKRGQAVRRGGCGVGSAATLGMRGRAASGTMRTVAGATLARRTGRRAGCIQLGVIIRWSAGRGVGDEGRCEGARRKAGLAVTEVRPGLGSGLAGQWRAGGPRAAAVSPAHADRRRPGGGALEPASVGGAVAERTRRAVLGRRADARGTGAGCGGGHRARTVPLRGQVRGDVLGPAASRRRTYSQDYAGPQGGTD